MKATHNVTDGSIIVEPLTAEEIAANQAQKIINDQLLADEEAAKEDNFAFDGVMITIAKAFLNHENRIRAIEGKSAVTLKQMVKALRAL